ncbi:hypothetical protein G6K93_12605 [Agrobacterium rhizogenes]|uniref:hypothetical protein n=1 Tax=Rhizobium rhizogenes TaxID=359 RepID=UPI001239599B|nr:hypothetical protein [Rhizobium rhizogenes]KAA6490200.1 hypothetical protein DXT98_07490 [Agrobacterium sp. ICMP 7243]NTF49163.1 hypothetical protein [Rhizobium rhizogenes]NTG01052.1 hypothetical protein [Rhizobium rhizogenes]NTG14480.1 hypothetical protein [Rhizobium rhizogenes]NTG21315.1 hypothetical protein [Rhizobium rhizogenes]
MRFKAVAAAAVFAAGLAGASQAADVNEQGAKDLLGNLTYFLPDDMAKSGFVAVKPVSGHYEITYDLQKLFDKLKISDIVISGLKPLTALATPQDSGLWAIEGSNAIDVTARSKPGSATDMEFRYALASSSFQGIFDPALHYVRSMDLKGSGITFASKTTDKDNGVQKNDATADSIVYKLSSTDSGEPGKLDLKMDGSLQSLNNKISSGDMAFGEIKVGAIDFNASATKLPLKALNEILRFVSDHKEKKTLSDSESAEIKALLQKAMPIAGSFEEKVFIKDLSVSTLFGDGGLQNMGYSFKVDGPSNAMNADFGLRAEKLTLASGLVPQDYVAFIPDAAEMQVQLPNLNFTALADVLQQTDFNHPAGQEAVDNQLQRAMFPDGTITVNFPKISAVSGLYDVEASGSMRGALGDSDRVTMNMTVLARDLDKTIAAVQEAAKTQPDLNQFSFGLMMAKGFAKTDPDGRSRWEVSSADDKTVTINGQVIK